MVKLKDIIHEISVTTGGTRGYIGAAGDIVDQLYGGAFHPKFGEIEKLLNKQIDDDIAMRLYSDDVTPKAEQDFIDMEHPYVYDKVEKSDNSKFINNSIKNWKHINLDIKYDDNEPKYNSNHFINQSETNMEYVHKDYHTKMSDKNMKISDVIIKFDEEMEEEFLEDRNSSIYAGDNFINKSTTNWKYIK